MNQSKLATGGGMLASVLALATFTGRGQIPRLGQFEKKKNCSKEDKVERIGSNVLGLMKKAQFYYTVH